jgi:hypothetical protein
MMTMNELHALRDRMGGRVRGLVLLPRERAALCTVLDEVIAGRTAAVAALEARGLRALAAAGVDVEDAVAHGERWMVVNVPGLGRMGARAVLEAFRR